VANGSRPGEAPRLQFTVSDTGIGIPPEKQKLIFEAFSQADASTTRRYGGTGLGLTISARLVQMMGGTIWVESQPGRGTSVHFTAEVAAAPARSDAHAAQTGCLQGLSVLVADGSEASRRALADLLSRWGMKAAQAADGPAAVEALAEAARSGDPFRFVLADAHLPGMDAGALAQHAGERSTVVLLAPYGPGCDAARREAAGAVAWLTKPVRRAELRDALLRGLPYPSNGAAAAAAVTAPAAQEAAPVRPLRILLAEDNVVNQHLARVLLEKRGHKVCVAGNGREAVALFDRQAFDVVLMDVQMPEMDGFEATAALRFRENGTGRRVPIIALTAHAMKGDQERCLQAGMDGYVSKPINVEALFAAIGAALAA